MALAKTDEIDRIEVQSEYKHIGIRHNIVVKEDGVQISQAYHRRMLNSGLLDADNNLVETDISNESSEIQSICNIVWTDEVKTAWKNKMIADKTP